MTHDTHYQLRLPPLLGQTRISPNIPAVGDTFREELEDNNIRFAFQNIHGLSHHSGLHVSTEIDAMSQWNISVMGMAETNRAWTAHQRFDHDFMMTSHFPSSRTLYASAPIHAHDQTYQPGGNLLSVTGRTTGRIYDYGTDEMGRFCWYALRGKRDEGVLVVVAYRVCHKASDKPGPFTAYQQQHTYLRTLGVANPNPRSQVLKDIATLISTKRQEGLRPIVMMDANGDYQHGSDNELTAFIDNAGLCDPFYEKFKITTPTYAHGAKRLDYIFTDPALMGAITRIGYLGTHDGIPSDHVMAVMDMDERTLFAGILNRPPPRHSREILIAQDDKVQAFLHTICPLLKEHEVQRRVIDLATRFATEGSNEERQHEYHNLYKQFLEIANGAAKEVGKKKYGYARSPALVQAARMKCAHKMILDCKRRNVEASPALLRYCGTLDINPDAILMGHTEAELRKIVRRLGRELWNCQKEAENRRIEGLQTAAQNKARRIGTPDWESKMNAMIKTTKENAVNRKLSLITKGRRGVLDRIQIPTHTWLFSSTKQELYHYDDGVFEAYPASDDGTFHRHHTLKIPASDVVLVQVDVDKETHRWRITETLPTPQSMWVDITSQTEIEQALLRRNKRHLQQTAREGGISTRLPMTALRQNYGYNDLATKVLEGTQITNYDLTPEMTHFFRALKRTTEDGNLPPILGTFTTTDIQSMFKVAKERTSSDSKTLNYTLWKCLATDETIAGIMSILFSLPFLYGFANKHWTSMTDFMLEKKPGIRHIHTLRIIGKVAAEFNTCLKYLIGKKTRDNYEASSTSDDQHGFRPNRSSIDAVMLKLLTFESARMQRCTVATVQHDMTAHFDRMYPAMTSLYAAKYNVDQNILLSINKTVELLQRNVETALGVSDTTYSQGPNEPELGGMVQGKADVPQWSTQQTDAMLKAHKEMTNGLYITSPSMKREIKHSSVAFADDTDGQESRPTEEEDAISTVIRNLEHSAQTWSNLVQICGGLIALHKCNWQLIAWEFQAGRLQLVHSTQERMVLDDGNGCYSVIDFLPPNQPNVGLGYRLCPDGSQKHHFAAVLEAVKTLCRGAIGTYLTESEARQLLTQRLIPKISYALHASSFSEKDCGRINTAIRQSFLPLIRLNRHFPSAVLYGPHQYGGMEFPDVYTMQNQLQIEYIIKQLRWKKTVANDFLVTLDNVQICTGFTHPMLEMTHHTITYLETSFIVDLHRRLGEMNATIWVEDAWTPKLQRLGDEALMERFISVPGVTTSQLRQANTVRIYLRVVTIADLANDTGRYIPSGMLNGDWQAGSDLKWPYQPCPPKPYFNTFRRLLRKTFCTNTPIDHHYNDSMDLDQPLGKWLPVQRNTWSPAYRTADALYWRVQDDWDLYVLTKSTVSGFYHFSHTTRTLPLDSHPVKYQQVGDTLWTQKPYQMHKSMDVIRPPGHVMENTLSDPTRDTLTIGSDGSVYLKDKVAACAWVITDSEDTRTTACFLMTDISSVSSYRSELEGIYRSLTHLHQLGITPLEVQHWCDNESAVNDCNRGLHTPAAMGKPDADLILAIHHIRTIIEKRTRVVCQHIYGHQDTRKRGIPQIFGGTSTTEEGTSALDIGDSPMDNWDETMGFDTIRSTQSLPQKYTPRPLSILANIEADRIASETAKLALGDFNTDLPQTLQLPYTGSRALLRIGTTWITSKLDSHIRSARWYPKLRYYCVKKYNWSESMFDTVDWQLIRAARRKCNRTQIMQTSKIMHDWLPVMHMQGHITGLQQCPACAHTDETLDHLFHCRHPALTRTRAEILRTTTTKCTQMKLPRIFTQGLCGVLNAYFDGTDYTYTGDKHIMAAIHAQKQIGFQYLLRGFIVRQWRQALEALQCEYADRKLTNLLYFIWFEITDVMWRARNDIVHHGNNLTRQADESRIDRQLIWFKDNHTMTIARTDFRLASYDVDSLHTLTLQSKRERLRQLNVAKAAFELEQKITAQGQQMITHYFTARHTQTIGTSGETDEEHVNL